MKSIKIADIRIDGGTQQRVEINQSTVAEYKDAMLDDASFAPVLVFCDGVNNWLVDGFHRFHAARLAGFLDIQAEVKSGTQREAILQSASANGAHGIRLTNDDKRKSVMLLLNDLEWSEWPDDKIAKHCNVTRQFVNKLRKPPEKKLSTEVKVDSGIVNSLQNEPLTRVDARGENPENQEITKNDDENDYTEADQLKESIEVLREENTRLSDRLALSVIEVTPEEKGLFEETLTELREENRVLKLSLSAVTKSRDGLMIENNELKKQCMYLQKQLKKAK